MKYIIADIHGCYEEYIELLSKIHLSEDDWLYILGDTLDRGPEPVKVLLDIMKRQNVTYIMGNHDYLFLYFVRKMGLDLSKTDKLSKDDISDFYAYLEDGGNIYWKRAYCSRLWVCLWWETGGLLSGNRCCNIC